MNIAFSDTFFLRVPLLPHQVLQRLSDEQFVLELARQPLVREALWLASPDFVEALDRVEQGSTTDEKKRRQVRRTLLRYLLRMAFRATPFGLFAGVSTGKWGAHSQPVVAGAAQVRRVARLDMHYLQALQEQLAQTPFMASRLTYRPNNTLYQAGEKLRYVEYRQVGTNRAYSLAAVDNNPYVAAVLHQAAAGASPQALAAHLLRFDPEIEPAEAEAFIQELVEARLLISELEPTLTGDDYAERLARVLRRLDAPEAPLLAALLQQVDQLNRQPLGAATAAYAATEAAARQLAVPFQRQALVQVDSYRPAPDFSLSYRVRQQLERGMRLLARLSPAFENQNLKKFIEKFSERYEGQEVPLTLVLDPEMGLGYPAGDRSQLDRTPLVDDLLQLENPKSTQAFENTPWQAFLADRYVDCLRTRQPLELHDADLASLAPATDTLLPASMYAVFNVYAGSSAAIEADRYQVALLGVFGPSAANTIGRFGYLDPSLAAVSTQAAAWEQACGGENAVFAEIVHMPAEIRLSNVIRRPVLRAYEIPILSTSAVADEGTILLSDLLVSVVDGQLMLRSQKLGKRVLPRLSSAHYFPYNALPAYHFLCDLQFQGLKPDLSWRWGALEQFSYLPRVVCQQLVLAKARWRLRLSDLPPVPAGAEQPAWASYQERVGLPRFVSLLEKDDNKLPLDLAQPQQVSLLLEELRERKVILVEEDLLGTDQVLVQHGNERFTSEFVAPIQVTTAPLPAVASRPAALAEITRTFAPGSEWSYYKLYCGTKTADLLLTQVLAPLAASLLAAGSIDQWFFIRYQDPEHHVRVRFHGTSAAVAAAIGQRLHELLAPYLAQQLVWRVVADTYQRELERYGPETMSISETLFYHESEAVADLLTQLPGDEGDDWRWKVMLKGIDMLLSDLGFTLENKAYFLGQLTKNYYTEFGVAKNKGFRRRVDAKYRAHQAEIARLLGPAPATGPLAACLAPLLARRIRSQAALAQLRVAYDAGALSVSIGELAASYVHMFVNRLARSKSNLQETVLYDFLKRYYQSQVAQQAAREAVAQAY